MVRLEKDIIFYSNYCQFSKELLTNIHKHNLKGFFVLVCVEQYRSSIPRNIDRVPTIMTSDGRIIQDDDLRDYVIEVADRNSVAGKASGAERAPHVPQDVFSHTCAGFAYLDGDGDSDVDNTVTGGGAYGVYGHDQRIETPDDEADDEDDTTSSYERYKACRDADINILKKM